MRRLKVLLLLSCCDASGEKEKKQKEAENVKANVKRMASQSRAPNQWLSRV
jgi:hypothetical protein